MWLANSCDVVENGAGREQLADMGRGSKCTN